LTFGGINFPWSSAHILAPLVIGLVGLVAFIIYEATWATHPLVSSSLLACESIFMSLRCHFHYYRIERAAVGK
jgi:hypothetical protein